MSIHLCESTSHCRHHPHTFDPTFRICALHLVVTAFLKASTHNTYHAPSIEGTVWDSKRISTVFEGHRRLLCTRRAPGESDVSRRAGDLLVWGTNVLVLQLCTKRWELRDGLHRERVEARSASRLKMRGARLR